MTLWERKLWYEFLNKYPLRFQRQKAIGDYIVDFYCAKAKLIIELDGGGHFNDEAEKADLLRSNDLQSMGFTLIHIPNNEIDRNFDGVCQFIDQTVDSLLTNHHS